MRIVIQRVKSASVSINNNVISQIDSGLLLLVGIGKDDTEQDAAKAAEKIYAMRIFEDPQGKMNLSMAQTGAQVLAVPQFTLFGNLSQGRRPGFDEAASPEIAKDLFDKFVKNLQKLHGDIKVGSFKEHMIVKLENDGPVTFILDSKAL
jgi:D-tyrosyl-tRNA(Tyr) deacylase